MANDWLNKGDSESTMRSELQCAVTVTTPHHHRDGETEHGGQGRPTQSEQHALDRLTDGILPRVRHLFVRPEATVMTSSSPGSSAVLERQEISPHILRGTGNKSENAR